MPTALAMGPDDPNDPDLLNVVQAARLLDISRSKLEHLLGTGSIPGSRKMGWARRIHGPTLLRWIDAGCPRFWPGARG